jgi:hypothetical protein
MQHHLDSAERTAYYRRQASACATAAVATAIAEVRQAYLDLEQGWLCLTPKVEENSAVSALAKSAAEAGSEPNLASRSNVSHNATG